MSGTKLLISATSGGHLTEALLLLKPLCQSDDYHVSLFTESCIRSFTNKTFMYKSPDIPVLKLILSFIYAFYVIIRFRPDWVISTGAEVGFSTILVAKIFRRNTMFIETVTRYKSATRAARLCYPLVNKFYVQHDEALVLFGPKAQYIGGLM